MEQLNKTFECEEILEALDLNDMSAKIDEIITELNADGIDYINLSNKISSIKEEMDTLALEVSNEAKELLEEAIKKAEESIKESLDKLTEAEKTLAEAYKTIGELTSEENKELVAETLAKYNNFAQWYNENEGTIETFSEKIDELNGTITLYSSTMDEIKKTLGAITKVTNSSEATESTVADWIDDILNTVTSMQTEISGLKGTIELAGSYYDDTTGEYKSVSETLDALNASILNQVTAEDVEGAITKVQTTLDGELGKYSSTVALLKSDLTTLSSKFTLLADKISLVVTSDSDGSKIAAAQIVAAINSAGSDIKLSANRITLDGNTLATFLQAYSGIIGSGVFEGDYFYSKYGVDLNGNSTSDYSNFDVTDPYGTNSYFKPIWCVNLKTGEMWASGGKVNFSTDGSGNINNGSISWDSNGNMDMLISFLSSLDLIDYKSGNYQYPVGGYCKEVDPIYDYYDDYYIQCEGYAPSTYSFDRLYIGKIVYSSDGLVTYGTATFPSDYGVVVGATVDGNGYYYFLTLKAETASENTVYYYRIYRTVDFSTYSQVYESTTTESSVINYAETYGIGSLPMAFLKNVEGTLIASISVSTGGGSGTGLDAYSITRTIQSTNGTNWEIVGTRDGATSYERQNKGYFYSNLEIVKTGSYLLDVGLGLTPHYRLTTDGFNWIDWQENLKGTDKANFNLTWLKSTHIEGYSTQEVSADFSHPIECNGNLFVLATVMSEDTHISGIAVFRSIDGGITWSLSYSGAFTLEEGKYWMYSDGTTHGPWYTNSLKIGEFIKLNNMIFAPINGGSSTLIGSIGASNVVSWNIADSKLIKNYSYGTTTDIYTKSNGILSIKKNAYESGSIDGQALYYIYGTVLRLKTLSKASLSSYIQATASQDVLESIRISS